MAKAETKETTVAKEEEVTIETVPEVAVAATTEKKKYVEVSFTKATAAELTPEEIFETMKDRISQERAREVIPSMVASGRIKFTGVPGAQTCMNWSYKRIFVDGVTYDGLGKKIPEVSLTLKEFEALTPEQLGQHFVERISVEKAKQVMQALLEPSENGKAIVKLSPEEMVRLSYNRVEVEGIAPEWNHGAGGSGAQRQPVSIAGVSA